jgi:type VI protein secretion system component Hcp
MSWSPLRFLRPEAPSVSSAVFYTVRIFQARIVSLRQLVTEPARRLDPSGRQPMEELSFEFHRIRWTPRRRNVEHEDTSGH